jgi:hypothetical protein
VAPSWPPLDLELARRVLEHAEREVEKSRARPGEEIDP